MNRHWMLLGCLLAGLAVGLGAFGAHGLGERLTEIHGENSELVNQRIDNWKTAAAYQMYHSLGIILVGIITLLRPSKFASLAGFLFLTGICLFSGMLYALVLLEKPFLGAIVPLGGLSFIGGWIALAMATCCISPRETIQLKG
ncbi:MAG: DUF423 domain-containing protein [Planctomycetaceae bacterium]|nr:DUF423 domain-containing protein [Planctomycetaceae bacterium]